MARRRNIFSKFIILMVLVLAAVGGYTVYNTKTAQDGLSAAQKAASKVEKASKAARKAW